MTSCKKPTRPLLLSAAASNSRPIAFAASLAWLVGLITADITFLSAVIALSVE